jgi:putative sterol carrier protein
MTIYQHSSQLERNLRELFDSIAEDGDSASKAVSKSRLIMGLKTYEPEIEVLINGRKDPVEITYGSYRLRPDLELTINADALHYILLGELGFTKALAGGQLKLRGPVHKSFVLEGVFRRGQELYPEIWQKNAS